jgi:hypothetical protein
VATVIKVPGMAISELTGSTAGGLAGCCIAALSADTGVAFCCRLLGATESAGGDAKSRVVPNAGSDDVDGDRAATVLVVNCGPATDAGTFRESNCCTVSFGAAGCRAEGAGLAVRPVDVVELLEVAPVDVFAPPELEMVTAGPVELVTVVCDGESAVVLSVDVVDGVPVVVVVPDGGLVSEESAGALDVPVELVAPASPVELVDESPSVVAHTTLGEVATAVPIPSTTASAPTRPMYLAYPVLDDWEAARWRPDVPDCVVTWATAALPETSEAESDVRQSFIRRKYFVP